MDLFGDLPEPDQEKGQLKLAEGQHSVSGSNNVAPVTDSRGGKRKSQDSIPLGMEDNTDGSEKRRKEGEALDRVSCNYTYLLKGYVADRQGEREDMQDAHVIIDDFMSSIPDLHDSIFRLSFYAVFDGHGGVRASRFASQHLHNNLRDKFPKGHVSQVEKDIKKVFVEAFKKTDEDFLKVASKSKPSWKDGTTAVIVLAVNDTLYIANLGDSKAILCRYKESESRCVGVPLTVDHSPSTYQERIRIQKAGGVVREGRVMGQLEVARSIGDGPYKNHGVTCIPDVKRCQLTDNDRYLMIACDGLWKSYTVDESLQFVNKVLADKTTEGTGRRSVEDVKFDTVCSKLASAAVLRLSGDNVTVMVVSITKRPPVI